MEAFRVHLFEPFVDPGHESSWVASGREHCYQTFSRKLDAFRVQLRLNSWEDVGVVSQQGCVVHYHVRDKAQQVLNHLVLVHYFIFLVLVGSKALQQVAKAFAVTDIKLKLLTVGLACLKILCQRAFSSLSKNLG